MVTTRSHDNEEAHEAGDKRVADSQEANSPASKRHKTASDDASASTSAHSHTHGHGHARHHEKKVVQMPPGLQRDEDKSKNEKKKKKSTEGDKGEGVKSEQETPAPASSKDDEGPKSTAAKKEGAEEKAAEVNAEEGQVPKNEPNPDPKRKHGILERGFIYFLYRPKVEVEHPESLDDVSKFHILLVPHGTQFHRLIAVGKKALPEASESTRPIWGEVLNVGEDLKALKDGLGAYTYETKTMGTRHQPGARVAGSGAYVLHAAENYPKDSQNASAVYHTYLIYELAAPLQLGDVQHALHIHEEGGFTLQVKNPEAPSTNPAVRNKPESKQPKYPEELHKLFKTKFIPADPPALLDYPGAELLLIPSQHTPEQDTSANAKKELDAEEKELERDIEKQKGGGDEAKKVLKEMGFDELIEGKALEGHWE
ncbi:hypothetical protein JCM10908_002138 [Rhodotorula pacifica]|uniref:uncharacterized protein n=1 Tax=Rhodotorula pacifica TaxID=1495444 RepID=UPI00316EDA2E